MTKGLLPLVIALRLPPPKKKEETKKACFEAARTAEMKSLP